ncbi:hypothetical protein PLUTE_a3506 [Pseudoalteromonas luteoviolacea DSM 6061]|nr:hypothetical protein [Pseudoalteromonas luteoviolacea DSM 6061]
MPCVAAAVVGHPGEYSHACCGPVGVAGVTAGWPDYLALFTKHIVARAFEEFTGVVGDRHHRALMVGEQPLHACLTIGVVSLHRIAVDAAAYVLLVRKFAAVCALVHYLQCTYVVDGFLALGTLITAVIGVG